MTTQPNKTKASFEPRGPLACELCASCGIISEPSRIVWRHVEQALRPHTRVGLQARPQRDCVRLYIRYLHVSAEKQRKKLEEKDGDDSAS
jgi:hypothetical protein